MASRDTKRARLTLQELYDPDSPDGSKSDAPRAGMTGDDVADAEPIVAMVLDVDEGPAGSFHIWAKTSEGSTALVQVHDYCPYLYVPAPVRVYPIDGNGGSGDGGGGSDATAPTEWSIGELEALRSHWNSRLSLESRLVSISHLVTRPVMYFRPAAPGGAPYLRLTLRPGGSTKRAGAALEGLMSGREGALLERQLGMRFVDKALHEAEVKLLMRFLCDSALSAGAWFYLPGGPTPTPTPTSTSQRAGRGGGGHVPLAGASELVHPPYYIPVAPSARISTCEVEVEAPWRALQSLTADATQLSDPEWCPEIVQRARAVAGPGAADAAAVAPLAPPLAAAVLAAAHDGRITAMTIMTIDVLAVPYDTTNRVPVTAKDDPVICIGCDVRMYGTAVGQQAAAARADGDGARDAVGPCRVVFLLAGTNLTHGSPFPGVALQGAELRRFDSEREMLLAWKEWVLLVDPDIINTFQVRDTLGAIRDRFERLRLEGGGLLVSRLMPMYSGGPAAAASPLTVKSVVMYSVAWVKRQGRMSSNSNQETFQADIRGRVVVDVLRQVLTSQTLATFSLVDCCQSLLGETLEVLG
ncbi:hypothetical protein Vafri_1225, partial [Volvox africanus]